MRIESWQEINQIVEEATNVRNESEREYQESGRVHES